MEFVTDYQISLRITNYALKYTKIQCFLSYYFKKNIQSVLLNPCVTVWDQNLHII